MQTKHQSTKITMYKEKKCINLSILLKYLVNNQQILLVGSLRANRPFPHAERRKFQNKSTLSF